METVRDHGVSTVHADHRNKEEEKKTSSSISRVISSQANTTRCHVSTVVDQQSREQYSTLREKVNRQHAVTDGRCYCRVRNAVFSCALSD